MNIHHATRSHAEGKLWCGCKFAEGGAGFRRAEVRTSTDTPLPPPRQHLHVFCPLPLPLLAELLQVPKKFQSEPAFAFHILTHGAACLPLDLAHREAFWLPPERSTYHFGANKTALALLRERGDYDDGSGGAGAGDGDRGDHGAGAVHAEGRVANASQGPSLLPLRRA